MANADDRGSRVEQDNRPEERPEETEPEDMEEKKDEPEKRTDAVQITTRDSIAEVRRTMFGKEEVSNERIRIRPFISAPASISVKAGITINLGNYESARVDVMLTMPCYPEEVDQVYEDTKNWVDSRVDHERRSIETAVGAK
jgi:hypothetical protein